MHPALMPRSTSPLLCHPVRDWTGKLPAGGAIVDRKHDGIRALLAQGGLVTQNGVPIPGTGAIMAELGRLLGTAMRHSFIDAEFVVGGSFDATMRQFQARDCIEDAGVLHVFEIMHVNDWMGDTPTNSAEVRRSRLMDQFRGFDSALVQPIEWDWANTAADVERLAAARIERGEEGVVAKHARSTYRRSPGATWQRIKRVMTIDLRITDLVPQEGNGDRLGVMVCDLDGRPVRVPVGFSDKQRFDFMQARESLIGTVAELEAMECTASGALRQARFVRLRSDKL